MNNASCSLMPEYNELTIMHILSTIVHLVPYESKNSRASNYGVHGSCLVTIVLYYAYERSFVICK